MVGPEDEEGAHSWTRASRFRTRAPQGGEGNDAGERVAHTPHSQNHQERTGGAARGACGGRMGHQSVGQQKDSDDQAAEAMATSRYTGILDFLVLSSGPSILH